MKILITGSTGLLGQALIHQLASTAELFGVSRKAPAVPLPGKHAACDLSDAGQVERLFKGEERFDAVIHTQALSDVDRCEQEPEAAFLQNVKTTQNLANALKGRGAFFVHVSTDYVFDGSASRPYDESSMANAVSVYGRSKMEAERLALTIPRSVIVRPSTLFGPGRFNFCDAVVKALKDKQPIKVFRDQTTSPTYTLDCAQAIAELLIKLQASGSAPDARIYHVTNAGACTRLAFAQRVADLLGYSYGVIQPIATAESGRPAPRPLYSALTSTVLKQAIGRSMRSWDEALKAYLTLQRWII